MSGFRQSHLLWYHAQNWTTRRKPGPTRGADLIQLHISKGGYLMPHLTNRVSLGAGVLMAGLAVTLIGVALVALRPASGADHRDSPGAAANAPADITDVYAFRSPAIPADLVVAV